MKKLIIFCISTLLLNSLVLGQAKKPTIMVVPSDNFCSQHEYTLSYENQGKTVIVPDYAKALQRDADLQVAISKIEEIMAERGFPLKNLEDE